MNYVGVGSVFGNTLQNVHGDDSYCISGQKLDIVSARVSFQFPQFPHLPPESSSTTRDFERCRSVPGLLSWWMEWMAEADLTSDIICMRWRVASAARQISMAFSSVSSSVPMS